MSYELEDLQDLMNDLSTVGLSRRSLIFKTHYGFGEDLQGENDGENYLYITKEGADLMEEAEFGKWIKGVTFSMHWSSWNTPLKNWVNFPLPAADLVDSGLLRVGLFQSSPRSFFPGDLSPVRVKIAYEFLTDQFLSIKLKEI
jgi:hypothetical protein